MNYLLSRILANLIWAVFSYAVFSIPFSVGDFEPASGTGSYPWDPKGLQRAILFVPSHKPLHAPCFCIACSAYSEQLGEYLQCGGKAGLI